MMSKKAIGILLLTLLALTPVLAACAPAATEAPAPEPTKAPPPTEVPELTEPPVPAGPLGVTAEELEGVEVEFWHVWSRGTGEAIEAMAADFSATNEYGITVTPISALKPLELEFTS